MSLRRVNQEEVDAILGKAGVVRSMADVPPEERGVPLHEWRMADIKRQAEEWRASLKEDIQRGKNR